MDNKYENLLPNSSGIETAPSRNSSEQQGEAKDNIRFTSTDSSKFQKEDSDSGELLLVANRPLTLKTQSDQKKEKNSFQSTRQRREHAIYNTLSSASSIEVDKVSKNKPFPKRNDNRRKFKLDLLKCLIAFIYTMTSLFFAGMAVNIANDRMNENSQKNPLSDVAFDLIPKRIPWALRVTEITGMVFMMLHVGITIFSKHRLVTIRRFCLILGTLYNYRSILIVATSLPVPSLHITCEIKSENFKELFMRTVQMAVGMGLSINGTHKFCGDYLYSGHTAIIILTYKFLIEYCIPKKYDEEKYWIFVKSFRLVLQILCWTSVLAILAGHEHYTIDVVVAYYITNELHNTYHTVCDLIVNNASKKSKMTSRHRYSWWFKFVQWFEQTETKNIEFQFQTISCWKRKRAEDDVV